MPVSCLYKNAGCLQLLFLFAVPLSPVMASADINKVLELKLQLKESTGGHTVLFNVFADHKLDNLNVCSTWRFKTHVRAAGVQLQGFGFYSCRHTNPKLRISSVSK